MSQQVPRAPALHQASCPLHNVFGLRVCLQYMTLHDPGVLWTGKKEPTHLSLPAICYRQQ